MQNSLKKSALKRARKIMVGGRGIEPLTSSVSGKRSTSELTTQGFKQGHVASAHQTSVAGNKWWVVEELNL